MNNVNSRILGNFSCFFQILNNYIDPESAIFFFLSEFVSVTSFFHDEIDDILDEQFACWSKDQRLNSLICHDIYLGFQNDEFEQSVILVAWNHVNLYETFDVQLKENDS